MLVFRIPLTIFAFMGGAVAIGAGFGMQNLLKNLISGLMLLFGLYVWIELKPEVSWSVVASDLRYMINKTLTEHGIEMAFLQRDIHLDIRRPLEVRVLADAVDSGSVKM